MVAPPSIGIDCRCGGIVDCGAGAQGCCGGGGDCQEVGGTVESLSTGIGLAAALLGAAVATGKPQLRQKRAFVSNGILHCAQFMTDTFHHSMSICSHFPLLSVYIV